jgi:hypothetical protein
MTGDDEHRDPRVRIELCLDSGRIHLHRETPLGTVTTTVDR